MNRPPKIDRKSLKKPDEFVKKGQAMLARLQEKRFHAVPILIAVGIIVAGVYAYDIWFDHHSDKAWQAYLDATKQAEPKRWDDLKKVHADYSSSRPTYFAAIALGDHYFDEAKKEAFKSPADLAPVAKLSTESAEWYSKALNYKELLPSEKQLVLVDRGEANEIAKKYDDANADYTKALETEGGAKGLALFNKGRILELKADPGKAVETYEKVANDFPETEFAKMARNSVRRLKSPLFQDTRKQ